MPAVITKESTVACQHDGPVTPVASAVATALTVRGNGVLVATLAGSSVDSTKCTQQPPPDDHKPCSSVTSQTAGPSKVLKVNGKPVLLETTAGLTDGAPTNDWKVTAAKQSLLSAD